MIDGVSVTVLYPPNYKADAQRELRTIRFGLPDFRTRYGRYPYEVLTLVHPPLRASEAGGMEYPTLITTGGPWYGPPGVFALEITTLHEFGHQYFYGLIGTNEVDWPFLDEGLNSYAEALAMSSFLGSASAVDLFGLDVSDQTIQAIGSNMTAHDAPVAAPCVRLRRRRGRRWPRLRPHGDDLRDPPSHLRRRARRTRLRTLRARVPLWAPRVRRSCSSVFRDVMGDHVAQTLRTALFDEGWVDYVVREVSSSRRARAGGAVRPRREARDRAAEDDQRL